LSPSAEPEAGDQISAFLTGAATRVLREKLVLTPVFEALKLTNAYEVLRGRLDGNLIIVYSTGKVVFERS